MKDKNGTEIKVGDILTMELVGVGKGGVSVVEYEGDLHIYDPSQGYYPLELAVERKDMILERKEATHE